MLEKRIKIQNKEILIKGLKIKKFLKLTSQLPDGDLQGINKGAKVLTIVADFLVGDNCITPAIKSDDEAYYIDDVELTIDDLAKVVDGVMTLSTGENKKKENLGENGIMENG